MPLGVIIVTSRCQCPRPDTHRDELGDAAALFHCLADPTRLAVVRRLVEGAARIVELTAQLWMAQSTVSAHVACLRDCGLSPSAVDQEA